MSRRLRITDYVSVTPADEIKPAKVSVSDGVFSQSGNTNQLLIKIAATHAGIVTGNNTFYLPDKMRKGTATWTAQYGKPVLRHHNRDTDAIGRIVSARYVDLVDQMSSHIRNSICRDSLLVDDNLQRFVAGSLSRRAEIQFIRDVLAKNGVLDDKNYQGMGYSEIVASITDPEAIQKIRDGRYLTGSVSASTDAAVCSICQTDWVGADGPCDHSPGEIYDGMKAFLVAGDFDYEEYSFVNSPADVHSRWLELVSDGKSEKVFSKTVDSLQGDKEKNSVSVNTETTVSGTATTDATTTVATTDSAISITVDTGSTAVDAVVDAGNTVAAEPAAETPAPVVEPVVDAALADKVKALEAENKKLTDHLAALREEMKYLMDSASDTEDELIKARQEVRTTKVARLNDLQKLQKAALLQDTAEEGNLADLDDKTLDSRIASVDMTKIVDKLSSGLANSDPSGTVTNPSAIVDSTPTNAANNSDEDSRIRDTYEYLRVEYGATAAENYLRKMKREGLVK